MSDKAYPVDLNQLNSVMRGKIKACPLCHQSGTLSAMPTIMELREFRGGTFVIGDTPIVPLVVLTCNNCGNTILINAMTTGILDSPHPTESQNK